MHNRIDRGFEDRYSNFWLVTYTRNLYRFNRRTEEFESIDRFLPEGIEPNIFRVEEAPDSTVWATLPDFGIVGFSTDRNSRTYTVALSHRTEQSHHTKSIRTLRGSSGSLATINCSRSRPENTASIAI